MKINARLIAAQKKAQLTASDMANWFTSDRRTMETWLKGVVPSEVRHEQLEAGLDLLETAIKQKGHFPVPLYINQYNRKAYIESVRDAVSDRVSPARSAKRRV